MSDSLSRRVRKLMLEVANLDNHAIDTYRFLQKLQYLSPKELRARQFNRLKELLTYAYSNVEIVHRKMREVDLRPEHLRSFEDFSRVPTVSRIEMRNGFPNGVISKGRSTTLAIPSSTSGAAQTPFFLYLDREIRGTALGTRMLFDSWSSIDTTDPHLTFRISRKLIDRILLNELQIPASSVSSESIEKIFRRVVAFAPTVIGGHPSSILLLARFVHERDLSKQMDLRAIFPWGETLLDQHREYLGETFRCPVLARYGAAELGGFVAQECPDGCLGYHVNSEMTIVEVVDEEGRAVPEGERGRVLVTNLRNHLMPIIRYEMEDIATQGGEGLCGRGFPLLRSIDGRAADFVQLANGQLKPFFGILTVFQAPPRFWPYVLQYQFIQEKAGELRLLIVAGKNYDRGIRDEILVALHRIAPEIQWQLEEVQEIAPERSGKKPLLKSTLRPQII